MHNLSQLDKSKINKILVIRNDKIGDMVVSSNILTILRKEFPNSGVDMVVSNENKPLIEKNNLIHKIYTLNFSPRLPLEFYNYLKLSRLLRKEKYDLGIDLRGSFFNIFFLLFLGNVKYKIGFYTSKISNLLLNKGYFKDFKGHASHNMVNMMNFSLNLNYPENLWPEIATDKNDQKELTNFLIKYKISKSISICIDASNNLKQWPPDNFDKIIKYLHKNYPKHKILLVGTDKIKMDYLINKNSYCLPLVKQNLRFLYLLFRKNNMIIAPDGGIMHLAWASKSNLIALIPTHIRLEDTKPLGKNSHFIFKDMKDIEVKEVESLIDKVL